MRVSIAILLAFGSSGYAADSKLVDFNRDVRPILSDKCFSCHGPDAVAKKIPLRLDSEAAAKADLGGHRAISTEIRQPALSLSASRRQAGHAYAAGVFGPELNYTEIQTIQDWIRQGAQWQKHWAFIAPVRHALPEVSDLAWAKTPIDRFVLEQLGKAGLKTSPEAGRETLIRRVSLDLPAFRPLSPRWMRS